MHRQQNLSRDIQNTLTVMSSIKLTSDSTYPFSSAVMHLAELLFVSSLSVATFALDNGVMRVPPMGWLAWERYRCDIDCDNDPKNCIRQAYIILI